LSQTDPSTAAQTTIYTIGHSNHSLADFVALLQDQKIQLVVDVRSSPFSRYVPHANRDVLAGVLEANGISYHWMGDHLGGKPGGVVADYDQVRAGPNFQQGVASLLALGAHRRTAIMCSEGDHRRCHRHRLITPALLDLDARVVHVQPDGTLVDEGSEPRQLALF
jgi:uncharacterized protein (DUF488 family)